MVNLDCKISARVYGERIIPTQLDAWRVCSEEVCGSGAQVGRRARVRGSVRWVCVLRAGVIIRQCQTISHRDGGPRTPMAPQLMLDRPPACLRSPEAPSTRWPSPSLGPMGQSLPGQCQAISHRAGGPRTPMAPQSMLDRPPACLRSPEAPSTPWPSPALGPMSRSQPGQCHMVSVSRQACRAS